MWLVIFLFYTFITLCSIPATLTSTVSWLDTCPMDTASGGETDCCTKHGQYLSIPSVNISFPGLGLTLFTVGTIVLVVKAVAGSITACSTIITRWITNHCRDECVVWRGKFKMYVCIGWANCCVHHLCHSSGLPIRNHTHND